MVKFYFQKCSFYSFVVLTFLVSSTLKAQIAFTNPNMEGATGAGVAPPGWTICASTPDVQPGQWCCTVPAESGSTYVGICTGEYIGQLLSAPMVAGQSYTFEIWLAHSNSYYSAQVAGNCATARNANGQLKIYASMAACGQTQLIFTSPVIGGNGIWTKYTITFTPNANYTGIAFYNDIASSNLLMDNMTPVIQAVPLHLLSFNGTSQQGKANIEWSTAEEKNNNKFILERSEDGISFTQIAQIQGAGTSSTRKDYSFTDYFTGSVNTYYYRLKQVDFDAKVNYLGTLSVNLNAPQNLTIAKVVTNSFNSSDLTIHVNSESSLPVNISIHDIFGKEVYSHELEPNEINQETNLKLPQLSKGLYILNVSNANEEKASIKIGL